MRHFYRQWMEDWETRLNSRDTNRVPRPFDWGLEWTQAWPCCNGLHPQGAEAVEAFICRLNQRIIAQSDEFFSYPTPADFRLEWRPVKRFATGNWNPRHYQEADEQKFAGFLRFTSPVETPYPENNVSNARWFPAGGRRAVVVLPHWNSDGLSHNGLCHALSFLGIAALRMSMPYHDVRRPAELTRADYAASSNIARTIDAARQAVIDVRCCLDWLQTQGYTELGIVGTSLGSCYAFLACAHEPRLRVSVFNHAAAYFGDVVWHGQSTRHIREAIESMIDLERLRQAWLAISPMSYFEKFARYRRKSLLIYAAYDLTFLPDLSRQAEQEFRRYHLDCKVKVLPCGHYTCGETPFKYLDGFHIARFLKSAF